MKGDPNTCSREEA